MSDELKSVEVDEDKSTELILQLMLRVAALEQAVIKHTNITENILGENYLVCCEQLQNKMKSQLKKEENINE